MSDYVDKAEAWDRNDAKNREIERLRAALDDLVSAVDAHNKANGRTMIDPHATEAARTLGSPKATTPEA